MTRIRKITVSQIEGNNANENATNEIQPFGETGFYIDTDGANDKLTLLMFDGKRTHLKSKVLAPGRLYGSEADSGDGNLYDTIKLIPDADLYRQSTDQYLVVDPTFGNPGHIHLRAGGIQDNSNADLYIGGERTHVRVSDIFDDVIIKTTLVGEPDVPRTWTFNVNGETLFPSGLTVSPLGLFAPGAGTRFVQSTNEILEVFSTGNPAGSTIIGWKEDLNTTGKIASIYCNTEYAAEGIAVVTGNLQTTSHVWRFENNGDLVLPSGGNITSHSITHELWGTTVNSITLAPAGATDPNQRLEIYVTEGGEGNHLHLTSGNLAITDLFLGNDSHHFSVTSNGKNIIQARNGIDSPGPGELATSGGDIEIYAGHAGSNPGDPLFGSIGGSVNIFSGDSSTGIGGAISLTTGNGVTGHGPVVIYIGEPNPFKFDNQGLHFTDGSVQNTAWKGIPGPYADDAAAATAGVAIGNPYHKTGTGGQVFVRLT